VHEEFKEETIVNKVGGRFKLSTLIQKRLVALNKGARPLVDLRTADKMAVVIREVMEDKIFLDTSGQLRTVESLNAELKGSRPLDDVDLSED
jgi:DNA-directed RNA polymerase subunit omega